MHSPSTLHEYSKGKKNNYLINFILLNNNLALIPILRLRTSITVYIFGRNLVGCFPLILAAKSYFIDGVSGISSISQNVTPFRLECTKLANRPKILNSSSTYQLFPFQIHLSFHEDIMLHSIRLRHLQGEVLSEVHLKTIEETVTVKTALKK